MAQRAYEWDVFSPSLPTSRPPTHRQALLVSILGGQICNPVEMVPDKHQGEKLLQQQHKSGTSVCVPLNEMGEPKQQYFSVSLASLSSLNNFWNDSNDVRFLDGMIWSYFGKRF